MAFVSQITRDRWRRAGVLPLQPPLGDFIRVSALFSVGVLILAAVLPGAEAAHILAAVLFFGLSGTLAGRALHRRYPHTALGLCNVVTLGRLALTAALAAPLLAGGGASWPVFAVASVALALDGVDGWLARRQGLASEFGARFDMEVDAALALLLAVNAVAGSEAGALALLLGLPRYVFAAAAAVLPWLRGDLPERLSRKGVCVLQLGVLIALQAPILPGGAAMLLVPLAAGALAWSFAVDVLWLGRRRA